MVFIYPDFGTYSENADILEAVIKKHNHLDYESVVYEKHNNILNGSNDEVSMTWFTIRGCTRRDFEALYEDLEELDIPIALSL